MTSGKCFENEWFYMKDIGKYLSAETFLTRECSCLIFLVCDWTMLSFSRYQFHG